MRLETVEDVGLEFRLDADAGILDIELDRIVVARGADDDGITRRGKGERVREQVDHDLLDALLVGAHRADVLRTLDLQRHLVLLRGALREFLRRIDHFGEFDVGEIERHGARLDDGEIENVVHDVDQRFRTFENALHVFVLARVEGAEHLRFEDLTEAENVGERRAELIGDVADEFGLEAIRRFERVVAVAQRLFHARRDPSRRHRS